MAVQQAKSNWLIALSALLLVVLFGVLPTPDRWILLRTLLLGLGSSLVALPLGVLLWSICRHRGQLPGALLVASVGLVLLPMVIHVSSWDAAFGKLGWLSAMQGQVLQPLVSNWFAAIWIHGIAAAPQVAMLLLIASRITSTSFEEHALLDTNRWQVFFRITLPRLKPLLAVSVVWIMLSCAREIAVTDLYQIGTLAEQIYLGYSLDRGSIIGNWSSEQLLSASSIKSWMTLVTVAAFSLLAATFCLWLTTSDLETAEKKPTSGRPLTAGGKIAAGLLLLLVIGVPLLNVMVRASFHVIPIDGQPTQAYSLNQLFDSVSRAWIDYRDEFLWSVAIASTSATVILTSAFQVSVLAWSWNPMRWGLAILLSISLSLPGPVIGSGLARLFANTNVTWINWLTDYTIFGPVVASSIFHWPIGGLIVWFLLQRTPATQLENASLDGATWRQRIWQFGLVANRGSLLGAWILLWACCFGELSASQMVRPAGIDTVPRKMLGDLHAGVNELTAGITIIMASICVVISLVGWGLIWLNQSRIDR